MAAGTGYSKVASSGLVFAYDSGDSFNSYKGEPTTNYWNGNQFSIYNDGATNIRNSTDVAPPVSGYEVVKVTANNIGTYGQCILWNATYPNNNVATITNSIYAYLTVGDYVQVGQHWFPWYYGTQKAIAKNQWVRISETYTINEGNSYGNAALTYSTNGIAYFAMPQYEYKSHVTPFIGANQTRSATQALLDLSGGGNTLNLTNMSYDNNAMFYLDGTDDYINVGSLNLQQSWTLEAICYMNNDGSFGIFGQGTYATNQGLHILYQSGPRGMIFGMYANDNDYQNNYRPTTGRWYHWVFTYNASTYAKQFYADSILQTSPASVQNIYQGSGQFNVGQIYSSGGSYANGRIAVAKMYNRVLSAAEIHDNYSHYKTRFNLT
jgi:hypothetical protein